MWKIVVTLFIKPVGKMSASGHHLFDFVMDIGLNFPFQNILLGEFVAETQNCYQENSI